MAEVCLIEERYASVAKEIKGLINESIQWVNDGSELVDQSGKTLEEILTSANASPKSSHRSRRPRRSRRAGSIR